MKRLFISLVFISLGLPGFLFCANNSVDKENGNYKILAESQSIQKPTEAATQYGGATEGTSPKVFTVVYADSYDGFVNVRSEPSNRGRILTQLREMAFGHGDGVLVEKGESWSKVSVNGTTGWCYNKYLGYQRWYSGK